MIVGLTGGIGSGKTTISRMFSDLGIPCYIADDEAHKIVNSDKETKRKIKKIFGEKAYKQGIYQRKFISEKVFENPKLLQQLNSVIHPVVRAHFLDWCKKQTSPYVIKEAAILFESGAFKDCDYIINVVAPTEERIKRVSKRDFSTIEQIEARMKNQWSDEERSKKSDFIIENTNLKETLEKVKEIDIFLRNKN